MWRRRAPRSVASSRTPGARRAWGPPTGVIVPLALYSHYVFLPQGNPAAEYPVSIVLAGGNQTPPLFADKEGTTPLALPVRTDQDGQLSFYAAPGSFQGSFAGETFIISVDESETDPVWPDVYVHVQEQPSTTWVVRHHLGIEPAVRVIVDGTVTDTTETRHDDKGTTTLTFAQPVSGTAQFRR